MKVCQICKQPLKTGNIKNEYGTSEGMDHLSRHHLFPDRLKKYFNDEEIKVFFQISSLSETEELCYECHEEILQNVILNKEMITNLSEILKDKSKKDRIKLFHQIIKSGIDSFYSNK